MWKCRLLAGFEPIFAKMHPTKRSYGPRSAVSIYAPFRFLVAVAEELTRRFGLPYWQMALTATDERIATADLGFAARCYRDVTKELLSD